jgi:hypothetical protein
MPRAARACLWRRHLAADPLVGRWSCCWQADDSSGAAGALWHDSSDEEGAHAPIKTLGDCLVAAWPVSTPLTSLGQVLSALHAMRVPARPPLAPSGLLATALDALAGDSAAAERNSKPSKRARGAGLPHGVASWLPIEQLDVLPEDQADLLSWAGDVIKAALAVLMQRRASGATDAIAAAQLLGDELGRSDAPLGRFVIETLAQQETQISRLQTVGAKYQAPSLRAARTRMRDAIARVLSPHARGDVSTLPDDVHTRLWDECYKAAPGLAQLWRVLATSAKESEYAGDDSARVKFVASLFSFSSLVHVAQSHGPGTAALDNPMGTLLGLAQMGCGASRNQLRIPAALGQHVYPHRLDNVLDDMSRRAEAALDGSLEPGAAAP